jgi:hypothetical protein
MNRVKKTVIDAGKPVLETCADGRFFLGGELGRRLEAVTPSRNNPLRSQRAGRMAAARNLTGPTPAP